ncbi:hypothetical protein [Aliiroseovarius marinus]|uniref:hypothetical protein n=1 Tax=Aliiroseovarius marinus TaxID=2500159 RepID=UPI003D7DBD67
MDRLINLWEQLRRRYLDEDGAVTIDWIVMTAALVMLGLAMAFTVNANIPGLAQQISKSLSTFEIDG